MVLKGEIILVKKVLLIMPNFFDYPKIISDELEELGYEVDYFDDRPSTTSFVKAAIRINRKLLHIYIKSYFKRIMKKINEKKYNVVLVISGQSLSFNEKMIKDLKKNQAQARFILYQWDSQKNFPHIISFQKYFDKCFSFDREDVSSNQNLDFLPLFYSKRYEKIGNTNIHSYEYDVCFIGTAHPKKFKFINEMSSQLNQVFSKQYIYFFLPSRLVYVYRKFRSKEFKQANYRDFHFTSLKGNEVDRIFEESMCVLDTAQEGQNGLTIRIFEALGAKKKVITTNQDIKNYDFYKPENIYVYSGGFDFSMPFFQNDYQDLDSEIYSKYSLKQWLFEVLK